MNHSVCKILKQHKIPTDLLILPDRHNLIILDHRSFHIRETENSEFFSHLRLKNDLNNGLLSKTVLISTNQHAIIAVTHAIKTSQLQISNKNPLGRSNLSSAGCVRVWQHFFFFFFLRRSRPITAAVCTVLLWPVSSFSSPTHIST